MPELLDFAIGLVNSVLKLSKGKVGEIPITYVLRDKLKIPY